MDNGLLEAEYLLGKDSEDFIDSDLGRYIIGRVEQERADAVEKLSSVAPWRTNRIRQLQNEVWRCDTFKAWLTDLVIRGQQAQGSLEQQASD